MAKHWTQTPKGRRRISAILKERHAKKRTQVGKVSKVGKQQTSTASDSIAFAAGYVACWLETYARGHGLSFAVLTDGVGAILRTGPRREELRP